MTPLMTVGFVLIVLAVGVVLLAAASVNGIMMSWALPLFVIGVIIAILGAASGR